MLREETINIIKKYNIKLKKDLSQNFLIDDIVFEKILMELQPQKHDTVFEIGSGIGLITKKIAPLVKRIIACEIDPFFIEILKENCPENLEIIKEDILKLSLSFLPHNTKVIGNIPYHITAPVIMHLFKFRELFSFFLFTLQWEVGERLIAKKGKNYGILSIITQIYTEPEVVMKIPSSSFFPKPKPNSCLIKFNIREKPLVDTSFLFFKIIEAGFSNRRKMIVNSLSSVFGKKYVIDVLKKAEIDPFLRPENLSLFDFERLSKEGKKLLEKQETLEVV